MSTQQAFLLCIQVILLLVVIACLLFTHRESKKMTASFIALDKSLDDIDALIKLQKVKTAEAIAAIRAPIDMRFADRDISRADSVASAARRCSSSDTSNDASIACIAGSSSILSSCITGMGCTCVCLNASEKLFIEPDIPEYMLPRSVINPPIDSNR